MGQLNGTAKYRRRQLKLETRHTNRVTCTITIRKSWMDRTIAVAFFAGFVSYNFRTIPETLLAIEGVGIAFRSLLPIVRAGLWEVSKQYPPCRFFRTHFGFVVGSFDNQAVKNRFGCKIIRFVTHLHHRDNIENSPSFLTLDRSCIQIPCKPTSANQRSQFSISAW